MEFKTIAEAKQYLSNLGSIIIPQEYTYFLHCTAFMLPEEAAKHKYNKSWTELPLDTFTIRREMSFVERKDRVYSAIQYGGLNKAMTSYARMPNSKPFQIRVIMPRLRLTPEEIVKLEMSPDELSLLQKEYMGLGDMRHPKLRGGEVIEVFATSVVDEVTKTMEDIFYGIRQQDLIRYAQLVSEELALYDTIPREIIPTNREEYSTWSNQTFSLAKNQNNYRYKRKYVPDEGGNIQLFQYSEFEQDYLNDFVEKKENTI